MSNNLKPSFIRTIFPFLIGYVVSFAARHGLNIDDDNAAALITFLFGSGYYVLARFLEVYGGAKWGYILGFAKSPGYLPGREPTPAPVGAPRDAGYITNAGVAVALIIIGVLVAVLWSTVLGVILAIAGLILLVV